jgi:hypothetical protein
MWASIIALVNAWNVTAKLAEQFVEAYLASRVIKIDADYVQKSEARSAIIKEIAKARKERNDEQLIALNHALAIVERHGL